MNTIQNDRLILVPCDFSPIAFHAMGHGAFISRAMNCRLMIMYVAARDSEIPIMEKKLGIVAEECFDKFGIRPEIEIRQGSQPYAVIKEVAGELRPMLVIVKTGGGVQTIKTLLGISAPFLVIQGPPEKSILDNISFPINFLNNHDQKMKRVILFSGYYPGAVMHVVTPSGKGTQKERNISMSLDLLTKVMDKQGVNISFSTHDKKKNSAETILELSKGTDMIVIQIEQTTTLNRFLFGTREEKLITNADKIPVLCFNRLADITESGSNLRPNLNVSRAAPFNRP